MEPTLRDIGRSLTQLHMKVSGLQQEFERGAGSTGGAASPNDGACLDALLDLLEAVDSAIESKPAPKRRRLWSRGPEPEPQAWREGLEVASAAAHEKLGKLGFELVPTHGAFNPESQQAVESVAAPDASTEGHVARTFRRGWMNVDGERPRVVREAIVAVHRGQGGAAR